MAVDANDQAGGTIVIEGKSGDGTFYGVQTLKQLTEKTENAVTVARQSSKTSLQFCQRKH